MKKIAAAMRARTTMPPTTPPTMAPVLLDEVETTPVSPGVLAGALVRLGTAETVFGPTLGLPTILLLAVAVMPLLKLAVAVMPPLVLGPVAVIGASAVVVSGADVAGLLTVRTVGFGGDKTSARGTSSWEYGGRVSGAS